VITLDTTQIRLAGYALLIEKYSLSALPNWHTSSVSPTGTLRSTVQDGQVESVYPGSYWPGDRIGDHLEFALKYDGVNLGILAALFDVVPADEIATWINSKPTGKYARRIWFLFAEIVDCPGCDSDQQAPYLEYINQFGVMLDSFDGSSGNAYLYDLNP